MLQKLTSTDKSSKLFRYVLPITEKKIPRINYLNVTI